MINSITVGNPVPKNVKVQVEYDCRGKRVSKEFENAYEARKFYLNKERTGKCPKIKKCS